jgi:Uma2 family endonuclease
MPIRLWEGKIREPDITFYAAGHEDRYHVQYADPPDLAIEVLSPSTRRIDRQRRKLPSMPEKAAEYAEAGVTEYWIVDPEGRSIEVLTGARSEEYTSRRQFGPGDEVTSAVLPGLVVSVAVLLPVESPLN